MEPICSTLFAFSFLCPCKMMDCCLFSALRREEGREKEINLILGEIQGSTFYTLRNLHNSGPIYIVVISTLEERTKNALSGSFSWDKCGKILTPYILVPEFDVSFLSSNETSRLEFEKLDSLTIDCLTSEPLIPHTLPFKG